MTAHFETLLIVEDDAQIRNFIAYALKQEGFAYHTASAAQQAMEILISQKIDLMILDLGLPDFDGMEVIDKVRSWSELPILVVSARDQDKEKAAALDAGADDYFFRNMGKVLTTQAIMREIYGVACGTDTQALRALMAGLRRKIEPVPAKPRYILTEIGVGYRLVDE